MSEQIISFADLINKKAAVKTEEGSSSNAFENMTKEEIKTQVATAKQHALDEIEAFEKATEQYLDAIRDTILFGDVFAEEIEFKTQKICEEVLRPLIMGEDIAGLPSELYHEIRRQIYKELVQKLNKR